MSTPNQKPTCPWIKSDSQNAPSLPQHNLPNLNGRLRRWPRWLPVDSTSPKRHLCVTEEFIFPRVAKFPILSLSDTFSLCSLSSHTGNLWVALFGKSPTKQIESSTNGFITALVTCCEARLGLWRSIAAREGTRDSETSLFSFFRNLGCHAAKHNQCTPREGSAS